MRTRFATSFPGDELCERRLTNTTEEGLFFHATGLIGTELCHCKFMNCHFERLEIDGSQQRV